MGRMDIRQLDARFLGLFLLFLFPTAYVGDSIDSVSSVAGSLESISFAVRVVVSLCVVLLARRIRTLCDRSLAIYASAICMSLSSGLCLLLAMPIHEVLVPCIALVFTVLYSAAFSLLYLAWMEAYARLNAYYVVVYYACSSAVSSLVVIAFMTFFDGAIPLFVAPFAPILSAMLLCRAVASGGRPDCSGAERGSCSWTVSPRPLLLLGVFSFVGTCLRAPLPFGESVPVRFSVCVMCILLVVLVVLGFERVELKWLYQVSVPLTVAGILFALLSWGPGQVIGSAASGMGTILFLTFVVGIFCNISFRYGVNAIWLYGCCQASISFGSLLGSIFACDPFFSLWGLLPANELIVIVGILFVAADMFLVSDPDFRSTWGFESEEKSALRKSDDLSLEERCTLIARHYALTSREEEILLYIAQGDALTTIAQRLYVADSTMKTHSRHIYRKIGVENKNALREFVRMYRL